MDDSTQYHEGFGTGLIAAGVSYSIITLIMGASTEYSISFTITTLALGAYYHYSAKSSL